MSEPLQISWSQLRAHFECRRKAALLRAGHRSRAQNLRNYFHGMVVDGIMRRWLSDPHRRPGQMVAGVQDYIDHAVRQAAHDGDGVVHWRHAEDRQELQRFCVDLLHRLEPILDTYVLPYPFTNAHVFRTPIVIPHLDGTPTTIYLRGEMDLLVDTPAGPVIWDLKGTRDDTYWRKVLGQLLFYDLALLSSRGTPSRRVGLIQPMCQRPMLEWVLTDQQRREMASAVVSMAADIWRAALPCQPSSSCVFCEVRHACPRFAAHGNTVPFTQTAK